MTYKIIESTKTAQKAGVSKYAIIHDSTSYNYVHVGKYDEKWFSYIEQKGYENLTQDELKEIYNHVKGIARR